MIFKFSKKKELVSHSFLFARDNINSDNIAIKSEIESLAMFKPSEFIDMTKVLKVNCSISLVVCPKSYLESDRDLEVFNYFFKVTMNDRDTNFTLIFGENRDSNNARSSIFNQRYLESIVRGVEDFASEEGIDKLKFFDGSHFIEMDISDADIKIPMFSIDENGNRSLDLSKYSLSRKTKLFSLGFDYRRFCENGFIKIFNNNVCRENQKLSIQKEKINNCEIKLNK